MEIPALYLTQIREAYPEMRLDKITLNHDGMVNDIVIVNDDLVCRFPKHAGARDALAQETAALDLVRQHVDLPVPRFTPHAPDWASYRYIPGDPLTRTALLRMPPATRGMILRELVRFLRQLHAIPRAEAEAAGLAASRTNCTREDWLRFYGRVEETLFPLLMRYQREWVTEHFAPVLRGTLELSYPPTFINGDLGVYHILVSTPTTRLAGVIDFGTAGLGDPATDLAALLVNYGESLVVEMFPAYPELRHHLDRARFWAGTLELQWLLSGFQHDDRHLLVAHIGNARDISPIGMPLDAAHRR